MPPRDRIHLYRLHNQLGDLLLNVPAIRAVRERWPEARIELFVGRQNAGAVLGQPWADAIHVLDTKSFLAVLRSSLRERLRRGALGASPPDLAIYFTTVSYSRSAAWLVRRSGARERLGFDPGHYGERDRAGLTRPIPYPGEREGSGRGARGDGAPVGSAPKLHQSEVSLALARAAGATAAPPPPYFLPDPDLLERVPPGIAYLHPGAGKLKNRWPAERFADLARGLMAAGLPVALLEGPQDSGTAEAVIGALGSRLPVIRNEPIPLLAARFARAALYIGNDTGPLHLAGAVGCPTVGIYGWSDPLEWRPVGGCVRSVRAADQRLESIAARDVLDVALPLLQEVRCVPV